MSTLRLRLMRQEALQRLEDARVLATASTSAFSNSAHLLSLLGFELLLKLVYELAVGSRAQGHKYQALFAGLPSAVQQSLLNTASERIGPSSLSTVPEKVLSDWSDNFVKLRYPYEKYEGMTEVEYQRLGEEWVARDGPLEDATFRYHPEELFGMLHALRTFAEDMANKPSHPTLGSGAARLPSAG